MTIGYAIVPFLDFKSFITEEAEAQEPEPSINARF